MIQTKSPLPTFIRSKATMALKQKHSTYSGTKLSHKIMQRSWRQVCKAVTNNNAVAMNSSFPMCVHCKQAHSPLFLACTLNPPIKVVTSLLKANPSAAFETDCEGNMPLHFACEYGASPEVIRELYRANPKAIVKKNAYGMLPIHKACHSYYSNIDQSIPKPEAQKFLMVVLRDLLIMEPTTIHEEDNSGMCPMEHALESGMRMKAIAALQKASELVMSEDFP